MRSTQPIRYGYFKGTQKEATEVTGMLKKKGLTVLPCERYEFQTDRPVGMMARPMGG
jgi:ubiquitin